MAIPPPRPMNKPEQTRSNQSPAVGPIDFQCEEGISAPVPPSLLQKWATAVLSSEEASGAVTVVFCSDALMRQLNSEFREKDQTTDVLSFLWDENDSLFEAGSVLGEIYISIPQVERQAPRFETTVAQEIERVLIHGLLHLCGYDHINPVERRTMRSREEQLLSHNPYAPLNT